MSYYLFIRNLLRDNPNKQWTTKEILKNLQVENPSLHIETVSKQVNKLVKKGKIDKVRGAECYYTWK